MKEIKQWKKYPIFRGIDENDILALNRCFSARIIRPEKNSKIISQGEKIEFIYILIDGRAKEYVTDSQGNISTHIEYEEGSIIGLDYYISNRKTFKQDIIVTEDSVLFLLDAFRVLNPCDNFCPRHTKAIQNLFFALAKQNESNVKRIKQLSLGKTKQKIVSFLNDYKNEKKSNSFDIPYNRQELAQHLGVERTALSKELSDLQKEGKIEFFKNHFKVNW